MFYYILCAAVLVPCFSGNAKDIKSIVIHSEKPSEVLENVKSKPENGTIKLDIEDFGEIELDSDKYLSLVVPTKSNSLIGKDAIIRNGNVSTSGRIMEFGDRNISILTDNGIEIRKYDEVLIDTKKYPGMLHGKPYINVDGDKTYNIDYAYTVPELNWKVAYILKEGRAPEFRVLADVNNGTNIDIDSDKVTFFADANGGHPPMMMLRKSMAVGSSRFNAGGDEGVKSADYWSFVPGYKINIPANSRTKILLNTFKVSNFSAKYSIFSNIGNYDTGNWDSNFANLTYTFSNNAKMALPSGIFYVKDGNYSTIYSGAFNKTAESAMVELDLGRSLFVSCDRKITVDKDKNGNDILILKLTVKNDSQEEVKVNIMQSYEDGFIPDFDISNYEISLNKFSFIVSVSKKSSKGISFKFKRKAERQ